MTEEEKKTTGKVSKDEQESTALQPGPISNWLTKNGFEHNILGVDHLGIEIIGISPKFLIPLSTALFAYGFNYLQCQGAYDLGPGKELVSFYHLVKVADNIDSPQEMRLKVFLTRDNPHVPSVYWIWKAADWQERENYDMYGIVYDNHPDLKRILMPEDWVGWPLRKDYISPNFYELQDAY